MTFVSQMGEHNIITDASIDAGGDNSGTSPKALMMTSLAGCTGIDVVLILKKMRVEIDDLIITVDAELTEEVPSVYSSMHITYEFKGKDLNIDKLERAIKLSQEKYCGVSIMYKQIMKISWEINYQN